MQEIVDNIKGNFKLIDLRMHNLPEEILDKMEKVYESIG
jgi:hypothetical protein